MTHGVYFIQTRVDRYEARDGAECVAIISTVGHGKDHIKVAMIDNGGADKSLCFTELDDAKRHIYREYE